MNYTRKIPSKPGPYWCRHTERTVDERLCLIVLRDNKLVVCAQRSNEAGTPLDLYSPDYFEWCGPLIEPNN